MNSSSPIKKLKAKVRLMLLVAVAQEVMVDKVTLAMVEVVAQVDKECNKGRAKRGRKDRKENIHLVGKDLDNSRANSNNNNLNISLRVKVNLDQSKEDKEKISKENNEQIFILLLTFNK